MVLDKIKSILSAQFGIDEDQITENTDVVNDLGAYSLDVVGETSELLLFEERIEPFLALFLYLTLFASQGSLYLCAGLGGGCKRQPVCLNML